MYRIDVKQIRSYHVKLRELLLWLEKYTGVGFTITSPHRIGDKGVHGTLPLRAVDLRMRCMDWGTRLEEIINFMWVYDGQRPEIDVAMCHGEGSNLHLHLQVHDNTLRVEG